MTKQNKKIFIIAFVSLFYFNVANAAIYYVSPSGNANWSSCVSSSTPCSAQTAMSNAVAGDVVNFLDGTYDIGQQGDDYRTPTLNPSNSGTLGNPIIFKAENRHIAVLNGTPKAGEYNCVLAGVKSKNYIVWDGFKSTCSNGAYMAMMVISGVDGGGIGNTLKNNELVGATHSTGGSNNYEGILVDGGTDSLIQNNYIHGYRESAENHNTSGYKSYRTVRTTIENNTFSNNTCNIYPKFGGTDDIFKNNLLLTPTGTENVYIENFAQPHVNQVWHNNIIIGGGTINFTSQGNDGNSLTVYNNTFYNTRSVGIGGQDTNNWSSWNNIISGNASLSVVGWAYINPSYLNYNQYYLSSGTPTFEARAYSTPCTASSLGAWQGTCSYEANSINTNPNFINPGGTSAEDYKRASYLPNGRGGLYASVMGAYITGNEIIGYSELNDAIAPNAPINLSVI